MSFASFPFAVFVIAFFVPYVFVPRLRTHPAARALYVAGASLLFYATWYPPALLLIGYHTLIGHLGGRWVARARTRGALAFLLVVALAPLVFFKEYDFFVDQIGLTDSRLGLVLPLGISFYTFSVIGYLVDLYRGRAEPLHDVTEVALFVAFWPHLAAGPILRAQTIARPMPDAEIRNLENVQNAVSLIAVGLMKKLLIADNIGAYVNWNVEFGVDGMSALEAWATMLGFAAQIYADFSGYSDMAIGFALLLGYRLPANFNYPYRATSLTEFWHRWHISLSTWFRDYLYIPLGGSRRGRPRALVNVLVVFVLSGVWHGVGWSFAIWGALHGAVLCVEKVGERWYQRIWPPVRWLATMAIVVIAWAFFRLEVEPATSLVARMLGFAAGADPKAQSPYYVAPILLMLTLPALDHLLRFYRVDSGGSVVANRRVLSVVTLAILVVASFLFNGEALPFIYFEF